MTQTIVLTDGSTVVLDSEDADWARRFSWHRANGYARRTAYTDSGQQTIYLHREITGAGAGEQVDHMNGDRLDNRRANLRVVSGTVNECNKPATRRSSTGLRGVYHRRNGRYQAIVANVYIGTYDTPEEAHTAVLTALSARAGGKDLPRAGIQTPA